jgi:acyl-CoA thioesterase-1
MSRFRFTLALACLIAVTACSGSNGPTGPTPTRARISRTRFLAFGDSITLGASPAVSYPGFLQAQLRTTYSSQASDLVVVNAGVFGETVLQGITRFEEEIQNSRAEVMLVIEGNNNLNLIGPDLSTDVIRFEVATAKSRGLKVFVGSLLPTVAGRERSQSVTALEVYNAKLKQMTVVEGVPFVDFYSAMLAEAATLIGPDGLHPTEAGYRRMAEMFFAAIKTELEER